MSDRDWREDTSLQDMQVDSLQEGKSWTPRGWMPWKYERCKSEACKGRRVTVGFSVSDEDWALVMGDAPENIVCLTCFDERAQVKGIEYRLLELFPVAWHDP